MGRVNPREVFALLVSAYRFRNSSNYRALVNQDLVNKGIFTPNVRSDSGQVDAWRDYQQILSELGLICSTRYVRQPQLTSIGLMYIDGSIGYSEFFSTQVLAYQYPNGHKTDISPSLRQSLTQSGINVPSTRTELDVDSGVLVKPGVLILQVLIQLLKDGYLPTINSHECLMALVPTKQNNRWREAYRKLLEFRQLRKRVTGESRRLRDVQEWFQFLDQSDFVNKRRNTITLSPLFIEKVNSLQCLLDYHADPATFWMPQSSEKYENALDWYSFLGSPSIESQWSTPDDLRDQDYLSENYPDHQLLDEIDSPPTSLDGSEINLRPFEPNIPDVDIEQESEVNVENILRGRSRLRDKTRQHQEIISQLANHLNELSYSVSDDPNSVDLLATKDETEIIFEVKTINRRNFQPRIRLGVGQLSEYRYRRQLQTQYRPHSILVLGSTLSLPAWESDYFSSDICMGLICVKAGGFLALTHGSLELEIQNAS